MSAILDTLAELLAFISSAALAWQAYRLVRHQRAVRDLRRLGQQRVGTRLAELADQGAAVLEHTLGRWDARDEWLAIVGLVGLTLSFLLKLASKVLA